MSRYYLEFEKKGDIKYISHLDMQRLFKRAFKSAGIPLEYSQGYNPHPKMGFAQPLSLGYTSAKDYLEFNTYTELDLNDALLSIRGVMPEGIEIKGIKPLDIPQKSLASQVTSALYSVTIPIEYRFRSEDIKKLVKDYLNQEQIFAEKREKKTKKIVEKDIKSQIRSITVDKGPISELDPAEYIVLKMELDSGSQSNLSPEQVISSFTKFSELYLPREEVEVRRDSLVFSKELKGVDDFITDAER